MQYFGLKLIIVRRAHLKLHANGGKLLPQPIQERFGLGAASPGVEEEHERFAVRVTRLCEEPLGGLQVLASWPSELLVPLVDDGVDPLGAFLIPKDAWRNGALRTNAPTIQEDLNVLLDIESDRQRLTELALFSS